MAKAGEESVDAYIDAAPKAAQPMLRELRQAIKSTVPQAEERISYRMPFYAYHGRLIYFAAHRTHVGMYPITGREKDLYEKELKPYLVEKATLQFPIGKPLPIGLIKKVVKERARALEAKPASTRPKTRTKEDRSPASSRLALRFQRFPNDAPDKPPRQIEDADRVFPGEGVIKLPDLLRDLGQGGFGGPFSLETFNPDYWKQDPSTVARTGFGALARLFDRC